MPNKSQFKYPFLHRVSPSTYHIVGSRRNIMRNLKFRVSHSNVFSRWTEPIPKEIAKEYARIRKSMDKEFIQGSELSHKAGLTLYYIVKKEKPRLVLETGVSTGYSTKIILEALNKNQNGRLVSTDICHDVGQLVKGMDISRWQLELVGKGQTFKDIVDKHSSIDVFLHDSDHSYENMKYEFDCVKNKVKKYILSDDVEVNMSFMELAKELNKKPIFIPSVLKTFGVLKIG